MNERNVAALTAIIERVYGVKLSEPGKYPVLARELAAEGVLVPSALTDEEAEAVAGEEGWDSDAEGNEFRCDSLNAPAKVRAALERIAKGDQP